MPDADASPAAGSAGSEICYDPETGLAVPRLAVFMVFLTIFMDTLAATISTPALPYYAKEFGASNADIGYLFVAWSFTSTFCAPLLGRLSDRIGRRRVLIMSLFGAGVANLGQASATSYYILLAWRAFSGVWAAVTSTAQVYLADVCSLAVRDDYMARLSAMPGAAMIFGPGLGGGLSTFGLNFPVLADGALSLAAAGLVFAYLPESPQWSAAAQEAPRRAASSGRSSAGARGATPIGRSVYVLGASGFLWGIAFGTRVSMQVVALNFKLGLDALQVGYVYVAFALLTLVQTIWVTPRVQKRFGAFPVAVFFTVLQAVFTPVGFVVAQGLWPCLACLVVANVGSSGRSAANGPLSAVFTDPTNRGAVFSQIQMMTNFCRMVGPLIAGNLAVKDPVRLPWLFSGACLVLSAALLLPLTRAPSASSAPTAGGAGLREPLTKARVRGFSDLREGLEEVLDDGPEMGGPEDFQKVGQVVGEMLQNKNYPWVSHQDAVLEMLDRLLPPLRRARGETYEDLELLAFHADQLQREFGEIGGDRHSLL